MNKLQNRSNADIYLEYLNDWLTVERMAEYYDIGEGKLKETIDKGKIEHEAITWWNTLELEDRHTRVYHFCQAKEKGSMEFEIDDIIEIFTSEHI